MDAQIGSGATEISFSGIRHPPFYAMHSTWRNDCTTEKYLTRKKSPMSTVWWWWGVGGGRHNASICVPSGVTTAGVAKPRDALRAALCTGRGTRSGRQVPPALMAGRPRSR